MDEGNLAHLRQMLPFGATARLGMLLEYSARFAAEREVPDPYDGAPAGFERVLDLIEDACDGLVASLQARQAEGTS